MTIPLRAPIHAWCTSQGLPVDAWANALGSHPTGRSLYMELELGRMTQAEWNTATAMLLGVDPDNLMGRVHAQVRAEPSMVALARRARQAGLTVALLSNSYGRDPYDPYTATGVWELFDHHVISEVEGVAKPDPRIYEATLERMGLVADQCLFVDDTAANLLPAQMLGIGTVLADGPDIARRVAALLDLPPVSYTAWP
ncbi:HAD-IA family hydrolase [Streptosporangium saharense]|uniref:Putative hydrolase of the HAD superfamily n=1 Tax=Streptosporangium saharense TaxID=1706840 RepID=A0A7W7QHT6_9ACTN|nr:HAD-IA family hydrolase [Streptosporangium saharense]MBB4913654.1 putative hydrolase of the HAD superfamily [Streptosporangium saharense]